MYGLSKVLNEQTAAAYTRRTGMATAALRLTTVVNFDTPHPWWRRWLGGDEDRRNDLWSYIEVRDAARAFRLAIENTLEGEHHTVIIAARDSLTAHDVRHLVRKHFPALADQVAHLAPDSSLYDTTAAEKAFGFVAQNNWRELPEMQGVTAHFSNDSK
jgi:nucleoside-diphosphate-sugar epimerase